MLVHVYMYTGSVNVNGNMIATNSCLEVGYYNYVLHFRWVWDVNSAASQFTWGIPQWWNKYCMKNFTISKSLLSFYAFRVCYTLLLFCCSPIIIIQWHFFVVFYSPGITLDQRIEYISRAVLCAKSCNMVTSVGGEGEFLHELEEKMEVCVHVYILCLCGQKTGEIGDWVKWVVLHWSLDWPSELAGNTVIGICYWASFVSHCRYHMWYYKCHHA